jgi:hypothetical protein
MRVIDTVTSDKHIPDDARWPAMQAASTLQNNPAILRALAPATQPGQRHVTHRACRSEADYADRRSSSSNSSDLQVLPWQSGAKTCRQHVFSKLGAPASACRTAWNSCASRLEW